MLPQASTEFYDTQRHRAALATVASQRVWEGIGDDFAAGWPAVAPKLLRIVTASQVAAATDAETAVEDSLTEQGIDAPASGRLVASTFGGYASDGRDLESLLYGAVVQARTAVAQSLDERLGVGSEFLSRAVHTQVADAGRSAMSVSMAARDGIGWMRMVNPPCCKNCAVLAGRIYRYSQGFQRHPHCDCSMIPTTVAHPRARGTVIGPSDVTNLTVAERQAIDDGADFNRVVNAGRGRQDMTTLEMAPRGAKRLTPEGIYKLASDRDEALKLLRRYSYIV